MFLSASQQGATLQPAYACPFFCWFCYLSLARPSGTMFWMCRDINLSSSITVCTQLCYIHRTIATYWTSIMRKCVELWLLIFRTRIIAYLHLESKPIGCSFKLCAHTEIYWLFGAAVGCSFTSFFSSVRDQLSVWGQYPSWWKCVTMIKCFVT